MLVLPFTSLERKTNMDISKIPLTLTQLISLIQELHPKQVAELIKDPYPPKKTRESIAIWFLCCLEAAALHDSNTIKDTAWIFENGIVPMKDRVDEYLTTWWEDYMEDGKILTEDLEQREALEEQWNLFLAQIKRHFGGEE